jgi:hypothetical protein
MANTETVRPGCVIQRFSSHAEAEAADIRFYRERSVPDKMQDVSDLALMYAEMHGIDLNAQGPKRFTQRLQRTRS